MFSVCVLFIFTCLFLAVNHDPEFRPKITTMFEVLNNCFESIEKPLPKHTIKLPDFESFKYMTLAEAEKQNKITNCIVHISFEAYAIMSS